MSPAEISNRRWHFGVFEPVEIGRAGDGSGDGGRDHL